MSADLIYSQSYDTDNKIKRKKWLKNALMRQAIKIKLKKMCSMQKKVHKI